MYQKLTKIKYHIDCNHRTQLINNKNNNLMFLKQRDVVNRFVGKKLFLKIIRISQNEIFLNQLIKELTN